MDVRDIKRKLLKCKIRIAIKNFLNNIVIALSVVFAIGCGIKIASMIIPIYDILNKTIWLSFIVLALSCVYSIYKVPSYKVVGKEVDFLGLKQRVTTILEMKEEDTPYYKLLFNDVKNELDNFEVNSISIFPQKKYLKICCGLIVVFTSILFIPSPMKDKAEKLKALNVEQKHEVKKVEKIEKEIKNNNEINEIKKLQIEKELKDLKKEIKKSKDEKEITKSLEKATVKLDNIKNKNLNAVANSLEKNKSLKGLSEAIKNKDKDRLKEEIKKAKETLKSADDSEKKSIREALKKAAEDMDDAKLGEALNKVAKKMEENDDELSEATDALEKELEDEMNEDAIESVKKQVKKNCSSGGT